ncbi:uncharacterized protein LOC133316132 [Gastrolobium bilobum]|uniref:uncharacterized protein LOC133316132 n=1 Tax=Gastrolobium bilobum TaxID=150636 RepID=UPI002AB0E9D9|nr:uncharacterized protein LOC133316132 [Gastrolobium bilobum]
MTEGTRSTVKQQSAIDECMARLHHHEEQFDALGNLLQEMNRKLTMVEAKLDQNHKHKGKTEHSSGEGIASLFGTNAFKSVKLTIPRFNGGNPEPWIHKIQQFYGFHSLSDTEKFTLTSFHMDGKAEDWYHWMDRNGRLHTWAQFLDALRSRFGPSRYRDLRGELGRITQGSTVDEYQTHFEQLANQVIGIDDLSLPSYFESGLKPEIRKEVRMHLPTSLEQAIDLAKIVEDKLNDKSPSRTYYNKTQISSTQPGLLPTPAKPLAIGAGPPKSALPMRKLSQAEMLEKREKGLCFYCDEKFNRSHVCKGKLFILVMQPEDDDQQLLEDTAPSPETVTEEIVIADTLTPEISLHAMAGQHSTSTLRVKGRIGNASVQILVDGGSTHNFIQDRLVKFLGLETVPTQKFQVLVGNGEKMNCLGMCPQVALEMQGHGFCPDLYVLPIQGAKVVLGVQWLSELGDITLNYKQLVMKFERDGKQLEIQGESATNMEAIQLNQFRRLTASNSVACLYQFHSIVLSDEQPTVNGQVPDAQVLQVLAEFEQIFEKPSTLPPHRQQDHQIHLQPATKAISVRPYRYPHFQKTEMERMVKEMLDSGVVRPSISPFSSPALLVKKKTVHGDSV